MKSINDVLNENNFFKNLGIGRKAIAQKFIDKHERGLKGVVLDDNGDIIVTKFKDTILSNIVYYKKNENETFENIVFRFEGDEELKVTIGYINYKYNSLDGLIDTLNDLKGIIVGLDEIIVTKGLFETHAYAILENHKRGGWKIKKLSK
jgi:hypothetical protein